MHHKPQGQISNIKNTSPLKHSPSELQQYYFNAENNANDPQYQ